MSDSLEYPKLRWPLDIRKEIAGDQEALFINCPLGISKDPLLIKAVFGPVIGRFEGALSLDEIAQSFGIQREIVLRLATLLDEHLFLATPKFFAAEQQVREDFSKTKIRPAALAGLSYSSKPQTLASDIDKYLAEGAPAQKSAQSLIALVSPHIDYRRGGICYGKTYQQLKQADHTLFIVIGTAHQYSRHTFHLCAKDFDSPLGCFPCNQEFCTTLAQRYGVERSYADEILHRREHSLELQLPFLQRAVGTPDIVPILVGSFHHMLRSGKRPQDFEEYESFAAALSLGIQEYRQKGGKVCFIAGVDMAHIGKTFGDPEALNSPFLEMIEQRDKEYLATLINHDHPALFEHVQSDLDARRICGFPTMYTVLDVLKRCGIKYQADLFDYRQAVDYGSDCAVTFAGMGFYAQD